MIIGHGAEAKIFLIEGKKVNDKYKFSVKIDNITLNFEWIKEKVIVKYRYPKKYRNSIIDKNFRKYRTRTECKILQKLEKIINVPKVILCDENNGIIIMEYIKGEKMSDILEKIDYKKYMLEFGKMVAKMHSSGIAHQDLTTSNLILAKKLYLIDFGLSFFTNRIEDFAVDLHLLKESLEAKHWKIYEKAFESFLQGYKDFEKYDEVLRRLKKVEERGRYKSVT